MSADVKPGVVYFARSEATSLVKIGFTDNLHRRLDQVSCEENARIVLIGSIYSENPRSLEADVHRRLSDKRITGEWFRVTDGEASAFIDETISGIYRLAKFLPDERGYEAGQFLYDAFMELAIARSSMVTKRHFRELSLDEQQEWAYAANEFKRRYVCAG